jgi:hypothetical protein
VVLIAAPGILSTFILVFRIKCLDFPNVNIPWERSGTLASPISGNKLPSIQLKLNFCLPVASQLLHPKEMCLNAALNQIALYLYTYNQL